MVTGEASTTTAKAVTSNGICRMSGCSRQLLHSSHALSCQSPQFRVPHFFSYPRNYNKEVIASKITLIFPFSNGSSMTTLLVELPLSLSLAARGICRMFGFTQRFLLCSILHSRFFSSRNYKNQVLSSKINSVPVFKLLNYRPAGCASYTMPRTFRFSTLLGRLLLPFL